MTISDTVHEWFRQRFSSGPIARDTEARNQLFAALPDLIAALDPAPEAPEPAPDKPAKASKAADTPPADEPAS